METGGGIDEVHISVAFTYDIPKAEQLYRAWEKLGVPVRIGGPAFGDRMGNTFIPGLYLKRIYDYQPGMPEFLLVLRGWKSSTRKDAGIANL